jgi:hypothetical protein
MLRLFKIGLKRSSSLENTMELVVKNIKNLEGINWSLDTPLEQIGFDSLDTIDYIV